MPGLVPGIHVLAAHDGFIQDCDTSAQLSLARPKPRSALQDSDRTRYAGRALTLGGSMRRREFIAALGGAAASLPSWLPAARAQAYPARSVRIIVGFPPGQAIDIVGRVIADWFQQRLRQPFVVENRPGAAANIATEMVARSPADGYTLLIVSSNNVINTTLYGTVDFAREIAPIATF